MTRRPALPEWVTEQVAAREAEDMAARRKAYDDWATAYADSGVRVDDDEARRAR